MKKFGILLLALVSFCCPAFSHGKHKDGFKFTVHQKDWRFSKVFEMDSKGNSQGTVVKSSLRMRTNYDVYDEFGEWQATGIARIFCLGFFKPWGAEFDVYDPNGNVIGVIDGQAVTLEAAKYSFYNSRGNCVGIAFMDLTSAGFTIVDPNKETHVIARLTRNFVKDQVDYWDVVIYDVDIIDPALIKVFAAFAVDKQEYFKIDN
jgi:hypothetical protein